MKKNAKKYIARLVKKVTITPLLPGGEPLDDEDDMDEYTQEKFWNSLPKKEFTFSTKQEFLKSLSTLLKVPAKRLMVDVYSGDEDGVMRVAYATYGNGWPSGESVRESEYMADFPISVSVIPSKDELEEFTDSGDRWD